VFFIARGDGTEVLEFIEEPLDKIAVAVQEPAEGGDALASRHGFDVGPCAARGQIDAQRVAVIGAVGQQDLPASDTHEHVPRAAPVMGLALAQLERNRQTVGVDKRVDLGGQPAPRAPHASGVRDVPSGGVRAPFLTLPPC